MGRVPLHEEAQKALRRAGWAPQRDVHDDTLLWIKEILDRQSDPGYSAPFPSAVSILDEFGGLRIGADGPGVSMKRSAFGLDPRQGLLGSGAYRRLAMTSGCATFPIGVHGDQGGALAVDEKGRIFIIHPVGDMLIGSDIHDALNNLILGVAPRRIPPVADHA